jgi:ABC-type transport system involved in cytochrome c biogenesis permease subunit
MMPDESLLYFVANLTLFALLLLSWAHLLRPDSIPDKMLLGTLLLFLTCQGVALLWSGLRLTPWALGHSYLSAMFLTEATLLVYVLLDRPWKQRGAAAFALAIAFVVHTCAILFIAPPVEGKLQISPFVRSPWHLLHQVGALVAHGAYACAAGGAIAYLVAGFFGRSRFAPRFPSRPECQMFTRRALVLSFPWLTGAVVVGAIWAQLARGGYWSWVLQEAWLLILWLILTLTLHARTIPRWQGKPLAFLSLLGFTLALLSLPPLGQGLTSAW